MSKFGFDVASVKLTLVTEQTTASNPEITDTPLDHALRYADLGWYVIPVRRDKRPIEGYGLNSATKDPAVIRKIWGNTPEAGIAIACEKSGLVVLDIDPRNGGYESLARLEAEQGIVHSSVVSLTQGGGEHRFFKAADASYPGTLGAGLDIKHRGYVLVEPSSGVDGVYRWQRGKNPTKGSLPTDVPSFFRSRAQDNPLSVKIKPGSLIEAPQVYIDLEHALKTLSPEMIYDEGWLKVMQGMTRLSDKQKAYEVTRDWSLSSRNPKHTAADFDAKWRSLMHEDSLVGPKTVFFMADQKDREWRLTVPEVTPGQSTHPLSLSNALESGASTVTMFEYVFDNFMSTGVNVVAGAPGVGKTTLVVPLALAAAHLCPGTHPLRPRVRRNVIIITESVVQVQRVVYSLFSWGCTGNSSHDFDTRVKVIPARRLDPAVVAKVSAEYKDWTVDNAKVDGSVFKALPLVVLDTANAVLELENENDNAEVGRAMALIKQSFHEFPLIIVAHTSKVLGSGESDFLSPRGASAWTGDAQGVYTVFKDGEHPDSPRVLKATKVRFPTAYPELIFELVSHKEAHPNVLGEMEEEWFAHSVARPLKPGERAQLKEETKEQKLQDEWVTLCDELIDLVRQHPEHSRTYYERLPRTQGGSGHSQERKERAVASLINDGCLKIVMLDKPKGRADHYLRVDEEVVNSVNKGRYEV